MVINENFIAFLWKHRHLDPAARTESGEPLVVLHPGEENSDSGPDFFNARIRIGATTWAGNVEIHVRSSDWYRHGHDTDPAYSRVILHVVHEADRAVLLPGGEPLETLVVRDRYYAPVFHRYRKMMLAERWIPCSGQNDDDTAGIFRLWSPALAVERLEKRAEGLASALAACGFDWEEVYYRHLASCFGFRVNALPFSMLAQALPLKLVRRHIGNRLQLEALLYGQAGMLHGNFPEPWPGELAAEYRYLAHKFGLRPPDGVPWRFLRLRPPNFPTIRISQFAAFLAETRAGFRALPGDGRLPAADELCHVRASAYWDDHWVFGKLSAPRPKTLGAESAGLLVINGLAPMLYVYGRQKDDRRHCEEALRALEATPAERHALAGNWNGEHLRAGNALHSQALIHLKKEYCERKRCLSCRIGLHLLTRKEPGGILLKPGTP